MNQDNVEPDAPEDVQTISLRTFRAFREVGRNDLAEIIMMIGTAEAGGKTKEIHSLLSEYHLRGEDDD